MAGGSNKAIIAAFFANLGIAIAKFVGFILTRSSSMLAESVHSLADTGNQLLLLLGGRRARREATVEHSFGYGRERYFWSFVVSLVLFSLGSLFAIYEGIEKVRHPHEIEDARIAIGILVVAVGLESLSFRTAVHEANPLRRGASWAQFIRRAKQPELPVVLLEDLGALIGLVLALGAVSMAIVTGDAVWDGVGTICIGVLLGVIAIVLAIEMKSLLIGESASPEDQAAIETAVADLPRAKRLIHLRTQHIGPDELLVGLKVEFDGGLTMAELAAAVNELEGLIRAKVPTARPIYIEPDLSEARA